MTEESVRSSKDTSNAAESRGNEITNIPQLAVAIRSSDKNVQIPALKNILDIVLRNPESVEAFHENNIIADLNKFIGNFEEGEVYVLSSTILHVIGVRSKVEDSIVRAGAATESLIQIIHCPIEKQSKAGSKALCELVEENETIRNSLLTTGFIQIVLHTLTSRTQISTQSSSQSSLSSTITPYFIKVGLLNVILRITEEGEQLQSLDVLLPLLKDLKHNGENQLKSKAKSILSLLKLKEIKHSSGKDKKKDEKINDLEQIIKHKDEEIKQKDEIIKQKEAEKDKLTIDLQKEREQKDKISDEIHKQKEDKQMFKERRVQKEEDNQKLNLKGEKNEIKIDKLNNILPNDFPISIINSDPQQFEFSDIDGVKKKLTKKLRDYGTVSLTQVLENGVWQMETEFSNGSEGVAGIGIVRDSYNIPIKTCPIDNCHNQHIAVNDGHNWDRGGCILYKRKLNKGNTSFIDDQIVKAEFDSEKGTLTFFLDGVQQPVYVSGIKEKVRFVIWMCYDNSTCTIRYLRKLEAPSTVHIPNEIAVEW
ncbi:MAG: hypothetical protein EZS28_001811 [Streblomastix strix]|uniref:B30.2/SPRY domain-containing protein n=1 Tax=Streblomastix strix TaxID=222440 RepID=A0A5J4X7R8_9EUKA|nr:MAG: hypothetical protein EZS28_001811 [Streblomastix strix]